MGTLMRVLPDEAQVTITFKQLVQMVEAAGVNEDAKPFEPVGTRRAHEITGISTRELRRQHQLWHRVQQEGGRPRIRVSRKTDNPRSDLLFDENDCWAVREESGGGPRPVEDEPHNHSHGRDSSGGKTPPLSASTEEYVGDPDDVDAISDKLLESRGR